MDTNNLSLRQIGIIICYSAYYAQNKKYPKTPEELNTVTSSLLANHRFKYWNDWFTQYIDKELATEGGN